MDAPNAARTAELIEILKKIGDRRKLYPTKEETAAAVREAVCDGHMSVDQAAQLAGWNRAFVYKHFPDIRPPRYFERKADA